MDIKKYFKKTDDNDFDSVKNFGYNVGYKIGSTIRNSVDNTSVKPVSQKTNFSYKLKNAHDKLQMFAQNYQKQKVIREKNELNKLRNENRLLQLQERNMNLKKRLGLKRNSLSGDNGLFGKV